MPFEFTLTRQKPIKSSQYSIPEIGETVIPVKPFRIKKTGRWSAREDKMLIWGNFFLS
jgi:hypothetical protein